MKLEYISYEQVKNSSEGTEPGLESLYLKFSVATPDKIVGLEEILSRHLSEVLLSRKSIIKITPTESKEIREEKYQGWDRSFFGAMGAKQYAVTEISDSNKTLTCYLELSGNREVEILKDIVKNLQPEMTPEIQKMYDDILAI